jgi:hypothetical protein
MRFLIALVLFFGLADSARAQQVDVVRPDGTHVPYVPQRQHVHIKHDTIYFPVAVHDTTRERTEQIYRLDTGRVSLQVAFTLQPYRPLDSVQITPPKPLAEVGIFGYADFYGTTIAPSGVIHLGGLDVWLYLGAYYTSRTHQTYVTSGIAAFAPFFTTSFGK